ncbi:MAG: hypothetical protein ACREF7_01010 [Candidatus Saccharimonadales bacterium]
MSLTVKPRPGEVHKKIKASHHHVNKRYLKPYWPYLPIIAIVGAGFYVAGSWHSTPSLTAFSYYGVLESSIGVAALAIFLLRHAFAWHKVFIRGEQFISKHPMMDIGLVSLAVVGLLLAHHGGAV